MAKKRTKRRQPSKIAVETIEAQSIVLVDEYGTEHGKLSCSGGGNGVRGWTAIHINDNQGRPWISLQVDQDGNPSICLFTTGNAPGVSMAVNDGRGNVS
jgi:hypothetical protein